jgi:cytochrome c oxidase subunit 3
VSESPVRNEFMASQADALRRQRARAAQLRVVKGTRPDQSMPGPVRIPNAVLGVLIFLGAEAMLFAGLISACVVLRAGSAMWPPLDQPRLPVAVTAVNTVILLCSGYTMWRAHAAIRRSQPADLRRWLAATALLGGVFLLVQGTEWVRLLRYGLTGVYGGVFYTLIGCHGLHVLGALVVVLVVLRGAARGQYTARSHATVTACQLYWFFVVGVWPLLYVLVYLV